MARTTLARRPVLGSNFGKAQDIKAPPSDLLPPWCELEHDGEVYLHHQVSAEYRDPEVGDWSEPLPPWEGLAQEEMHDQADDHRQDDHHRQIQNPADCFGQSLPAFHLV